MEYTDFESVTRNEEYAVKIELSSGELVYTTGKYDDRGILQIEAVPSTPVITPICEQ